MYLSVSQAGIILGEQNRSAHSSIIALNELHNSGNIVEECGGGIIGQNFDSHTGSWAFIAADHYQFTRKQS